jgi:ubiquitin-like protein Pup
MATQDSSGGQARKDRRDSEVEEVAAEETSDVQERVGKLTDDVDSLLDEIDDVLEENAEDFRTWIRTKRGESVILRKRCPRLRR